MDLAAVFLLSLLGGYWFASIWKRTAYTTLRSEGQHLYFRAAFFAVLLFISAIAIRQALLFRLSGYRIFDDWLVQYIKPALKEETGVAAADIRTRAEWVVTAAYSLAIGPIAAWTLNLFTSRFWALERSVGTLDRLLHIVTAALFSPLVYAKFNPGWREQLAEPNLDGSTTSGAGG